MQKLTPRTLILLCLTLSGCNNTLDFRNAEISNNTIYEAGKNTGFSGKITNIPLGKIPFGEIIPVTNLAGKKTGNKSINDYLYLSSLSVGHDTVLCDTSTNDGILNGETLCKIIASNNPLFKFSFKNNSIDGEITFFYTNKNGVRFADVNYNQGKANGDLTVYGLATGKPIYKVMLQNSIANGKEEVFDENTGKVTFEGNLTNGKYEGGSVRYNTDGSVVEKLIWKNDEVQQTSALPNTAQGGTSSQDCSDAWVTAFHKEQGADAIITVEQLDEWKGWCSEGKTPMP